MHIRIGGWSICLIFYGSGAITIPDSHVTEVSGRGTRIRDHHRLRALRHLGSVASFWPTSSEPGCVCSIRGTTRATATCMGAWKSTGSSRGPRIIRGNSPGTRNGAACDGWERASASFDVAITVHKPTGSVKAIRNAELGVEFPP